MQDLDMKNIILGVNQSHDTSVACINNESGEVVAVYEEERCRRQKHFSPIDDAGFDTHENEGTEAYENFGLLAIDHKQLHNPSALAISSFDRRAFNLFFKDRVYKDRILQKELIAEISGEQLSLSRIKDIQKSFGESVFKKNEVFDEEDNHINQAIARQCNVDSYYFDIRNHHYYHAICGSHLSPYDEAIVIAWDGGGAQSYFEEYPMYQEIETIWHYKDNTVTPIWKRLSNQRFVHSLHFDMDAFGEDAFMCYEDLETNIDDVPVVFTSMPSMGMNFSQMSYALGCDKMGRAAGKVMGMASYGKAHPKVFTKHTEAQRLELKSLEHSKEIIQRALDMVPDCKNVVLSGGYSLNCTNNYKYLQAFPDVQFFVDPIPHDGGTAVGVAIDYWRNHAGN
tara:strand:+ start:95 stop:1282 length:1188 start_codon:yes stop_codon:yes gene_type:complete